MTTLTAQPSTRPAASERIIRAARRLWLLPTHRWFAPAVMILFMATAVFFAIVVYIPPDAGIRDGVHFITRTSRVPDEFRHIGNILFYAERPVTDGPFVTHISNPALWLGDVERFPSYLYYYVMSFPARLFEAMHLTYATTVILLRVLTSLTGLASIVITRRILLAVGASTAIAGWSIAALAFTGRFVWQSAGVTYDIPSMALFLLFLLAIVRFLQTASARMLLAAIAYACLASITKYTFMPFVVAIGVAAILYVAISRRRRHEPGLFVSAGGAWREHRVSLVLLVLAAVASLALFVERIVVNYLRFGAADPDCDKIYARAACLANFDIFRRNTVVAQQYHAALASGAAQAQHYSPFSFTGMWTNIYYQSMFFYRGPGTSWSVTHWVLVLGFVALVLGLIVTILATKRLWSTPSLIFVAGASVLYAASLYVFNLHTYLSVDRLYAFSGRYMLPVYAFGIAASLYGALWLWRKVPAVPRAVIAILAIVFVAVLVLTHDSILSFLSYATTPSWFSQVGAPLMLRIAGHLHP